MPAPSHNPHDRFFRGAFSFRELMEEYVQQFLPKELVSNFHLETLEQKKDSYLDKNLQQYFSDVVYTVGYGDKRVEVTLLLEHKSYVPPHPWLQLLRYMVNAYSAQAGQKKFPGIFRPVIPIIVYHGNEKWKIRPIASYFEGIDEQLNAFVPNFDYLLNDLSKYTEDELLAMGGELVGRTFLALKLSRKQDEFRRALLVFQGFSGELTGVNSTNFIELLFVYLLQSGNSQETIMRAIDRIDSPAKEKVMSAYDQILQAGVEVGLEKGIEKGIEKGMEKGIEKGIEKGKERAAFETFKKGISMGIPLTDLTLLTGITDAMAMSWQKLLQENPEALFPEQ